eukprot:CAMPEP_0174370104 /NCGR_PEP_ID=MMETSP0811_2-20130205/94964_1 /TAXON_ID=73025 ORGANISM="Eutreptiella gymnastica-like, Strain CCMP1594" /NCGR_SAMPLE_ID=MMETSP0811_2 /ASSEMBLY_ACC=CAM_ASM_000667 /LENGTH=37 /DNA_ID= /DNA_START= /DNA_END= /DNA_ORIENTATION=
MAMGSPGAGVRWRPCFAAAPTAFGRALGPPMSMAHHV